MTYTHLTQDERYQIAILLKAGHQQNDIARVMNRHPSTISRLVPLVPFDPVSLRRGKNYPGIT